MQSYSPFDKTIRDLKTEDLQCLRQSSEGWYIEYKRETPEAMTLAKSVSAFANTYGGWLFLGIQEESKENPVAGKFPGIPKEEVDSSLQRIRSSAADSINPTPYFETCVLWGPNSDLDLAKDRAIICAWIPMSIATPHVHKSGRIYRRVSDGSEPRPESDRFILDQLWHRADGIKHDHKEWYDRDPEFSVQEKEQPYIRLMLIADRLATHKLWMTATDEQIRSILEENAGIISTPFDTVYTSANGFVGRQLNCNDPHNLGLTWRLRHSLVSDVIIPLPFYQVDDPTMLSIYFGDYKEIANFIDILQKYKTSTLRIVDLNYVFNILLGVARIQDSLCDLAGWMDSYFLKVKVLNSWRTIPFVDIPEVIQRFDKFGPPMCLDTTATYPSGSELDTYIEILRDRDSQDEHTRLLVQGLDMFFPLAQIFGIPNWLQHDNGEIATPYYIALHEAGRRAIDIQGKRNAKPNY